jgi:hypothetical protein
MSDSACSRQLTLNFRTARDTSRTCNLDDAAVHRPLQVSDTDALAQLLALHKPFGVQSWAIVVGGCDD